MIQALKNEISSALASIGTSAPALMASSRVEKVYEIFVLSCLVRALRGIGSQLEARDINDGQTNALQFRYSPGHINAPTSSPGFIHVTYDGREYEIQNSLQVLGTSLVMHELDVCLMDRQSAVDGRATGAHPKHVCIKFFAECKCYGDSLPLHLGREFIGLNKDCRGKAVRTFVSNTDGGSVAKLLYHYSYVPAFDILPTNPASVDHFVGWLEHELKGVLR